MKSEPHLRRIEWTLFCMAALASVYFYQGGGWNQNSRFDQVRAIVEAGRLDINNYMIYAPRRGADGRVRFERQPAPANIARNVELPTCNSWDIAIRDGRVFPNKPPGMVFLAVPAYWLIHAVEAWRGIDPDSYWPLTINLYLTAALTLAPLAGIGVVVFLRLARRLSPTVALRTHVLATVAMFFGTIMWPFSTMLFDHMPVAVISLCAFSLLVGPLTSRRIVSAGLLAGLMVLLNYTAIVILASLALYLIRCSRSSARVAIFLLAALPALFVLGCYHRACFGSFFATANTYQTTLFSDNAHLWLGMFSLPNPLHAIFLLISPHYGLLVTAPVLILACAGWRSMRADQETRLEAEHVGTVFVALFLINAAFNGWDGGYSFGPRYLLPAIPLLCLALPRAFVAHAKWARRLTVISVGITTLVTAINPLTPNNYIEPFTQYFLPLAVGRTVDLYGVQYESPLSSNPRGVYEYGFPRSMFPLGSAELSWNAFNLGELFFPRSWLSLVPLGLGMMFLFAFSVRFARRLEIDGRAG